MEVIKFRAWDKSGKKWASQVEVGSILYELTANAKNQDVTDAYDLSQFTGLTDKNGKEIYEGDIISSTCLIPEDKKIIAKVLFDEKRAMWIVEEIDPTYSETEYLCEVTGSKWPNRSEIIGNIYENPELITK